jgi:hypothetical protein
MGILDEAIREHLELKRRSGAADSELKRMEDEAFGPPSRPGEPDFPESEELPVPPGNGATAETVVERVPAAEEAPAAPEAPIAPPSEPAPPEEGDEEGVEETPPDPGEAAQPAEPAASEHPVVDVQDEPDDRTAIYDHSADQEPQEEGPRDVPIESLETVEHPFPDELTEPESAEHAAHPPTESEGDAPAAPAEGVSPPEEPEGEGDDEDVLADTPDFLKDAPEDDELWFEQGEPKDFDF